MPSNTDTDKQNDNLEQASKADKKFNAFKKRMFWSGVFLLIAAIALSLSNYFACEKGDNIVGAVIFLFVVAADIFILRIILRVKKVTMLLVWPFSYSLFWQTYSSCSPQSTMLLVRSFSYLSLRQTY